MSVPNDDFLPEYVCYVKHFLRQQMKQKNAECPNVALLPVHPRRKLPPFRRRGVLSSKQLPTAFDISVRVQLLSEAKVGEVRYKVTLVHKKHVVGLDIHVGESSSVQLRNSL